MSTIQFPLGRGERLLWSGEPRRGPMLRPSDAFIIPFSALWAGFALFWNVSVWASGAPIFFRLWGLPFLAAGAYITVGRFWFDSMRRARTAYGVTNERVIIASGVFSPTIKSLNLRTLSDVTLTERRDGSGTITFGPAWPGGRLSPGGAWPGSSFIPGFEGIPNARKVYDMIREAQMEAGRPGTT